MKSKMVFGIVIKCIMACGQCNLL